MRARIPSRGSRRPRARSNRSACDARKTATRKTPQRRAPRPRAACSKSPLQVRGRLRQPRRQIHLSRIRAENSLNQGERRERQADCDENLPDGTYVQRADQADFRQRRECAAGERSRSERDEPAQSWAYRSGRTTPRAIRHKRRPLKRAMREIQHPHQTPDERVAGREQKIEPPRPTPVSGSSTTVLMPAPRHRDNAARATDRQAGVRRRP